MADKGEIKPLLCNRRVVPLFAARVACNAGDGFGQIALAWGTLHLGYGAKGLSVVLACKAFPALLVLAGGVLGDRFRRHQVLIAADLLAAVTWVALAVCFLVGAAPLALLCVLAALSGLARAIYMPVVKGIVVDLVRREERQVANALVNQSESVGLIIGLLASGAVVAAVGPGWAAALKAALALGSARLLARLDTPVWRQEGSRLWVELRAGWREFASCQWVWVITIQYTVVMVAVASFFGVIGPLHMKQGHGGSGAWGFVLGCEAFGALLGAFVAARWRPGRPMLVAAVLPASAAAPMLLLGGGAPWPVLAAVILLPGACQTAYFVFWATAIQDSFSPQVLSRVNSWGVFGGFALTPVALLAVGPIADAVGAQTAAVGAGALVLAATAVALVSPQVRAFGGGAPATKAAGSELGGVVPAMPGEGG